MGSRLTETMRGGILVPDARVIDATNLAVNDGTANASSYTEAGPRPGSAVITDANAKLRPMITGGQSADVKIRTSKGGHPGREGCEMIYKTGTQWRGWLRPVVPMGWQSVVWSDAVIYNRFDVVVVPSTQTALAAYGNGLSDTVTTTFAFSSPGVWSATVAPVFPATMTDGGAMAMVVIPGSERVLLVQWDLTVAAADNGALEVSYSDNAGTSWAAYSSPARYVAATNPLGSGSFPTSMRAAYQPSTGNIVLFVSDSSDATVLQYASNDLLNTVTLVETQASWGYSATVFALPGTGGGLGVIYRKQADNLAYFARLSSAYQKLSEASPVAIDAALTIADLTGWADPDGTLWAVGRRSAAGSADIVVGWVSYDLGATWTDMDEIVSTGQDTTYLENFAATSVAGQAMLLHNWAAAPGNEDGSIGSMLLGGWQALTITKNQTANHMTFSKDSGTDGRTWFPVELPEDLSEWSRAGTAPTLAAGAMNLVTAAATSVMTHSAMTMSGDELLGLMDVQLVSGATVDLVSPRIGNGVTMWEFTIRLTNTGFAIYDDNTAATLGVAAVVDASTFVTIAYEVQQVGATATVSTWYWRLGDTTATAGPTGILTSAASALTHRIRIGHISSVTAETNWRMFHFRGTTATEGWSWGIEDFDSKGRPINGIGYPLPDIGTTTQYALLAAEAGPGRTGDQWDIDTEHDHPIEHCLPGLYPGTDTFWRSTSTAEQRITLTLGASAQDLTRLGGGYSLGLALLGCRGFRMAELRGYTTAAGWTTLGTLDLGEDLPFVDKIGDLLVPTTTDLAAGSRFVRWGEYDGGYFIFDESNSTHKILHHNGGWWTKNTTAVPHYRIETPTGAANGSDFEGNAVVSPSGVMVIHLANRTVYERFQVRITAGQSSPWSYYQISSILLGAVVVPGQQPSNGWQKRQVVNTEEVVSRSGVRRVRELGEPTWDWSWSWVDGMLHSRLLINADYRGSSVGAPLTATQDVFHWLAGIIRQDLKSGEIPVVALEEVPDASGTTITAPDLYAHGHLSATVQATQIQGDDGAPEMVRVESVLLRGLPKPKGSS